MDFDVSLRLRIKLSGDRVGGSADGVLPVGDADQVFADTAARVQRLESLFERQADGRSVARRGVLLHSRPGPGGVEGPDRQDGRTGAVEVHHPHIERRVGVLPVPVVCDLDNALHGLTGDLAFGALMTGMIGHHLRHARGYVDQQYDRRTQYL